MDTDPRPSAPRFACRALPPDRFLVPEMHLFDPAHGVDLEGDLLVEDGRISALGADIEQPPDVEVLSDLRGCWLFPGLVDPHAHLRTPGYEYKEDLASGSRAAAAGGYVAVVAMANTDPVVDGGPVAGWVLDQAEREADVRVAQAGSISKGLAGEELSEMRELAEAGVAAYSDDGKPVADADLLLHALRYARGTGRPLMLHLENRSLSVDGVMHEGRWSARLGLRGLCRSLNMKFRLSFDGRSNDARKSSEKAASFSTGTDVPDFASSLCETSLLRNLTSFHAACSFSLWIPE